MLKENATDEKRQIQDIDHRLGNTEAKITHLKEEVGINTGTRKHFEQRLDELEAKFVDMEGKIKDAKTTSGDEGMPVKEPSTGNTDLMKELNERKAKENNIIVHGNH